MRTPTQMDSVTRGLCEDHTCMGSVLGICTGSCPRIQRTHTWMDSVTDLIWLTVGKRQLPACNLGCLSSVPRVGHCEVIAHHLHVHLCQELLPALPVILVRRVLN